MKKRHEKPFLILLLGLIGLTALYITELDSNLLAFSDGTSFKSGTGQNLQLAKAWIGYEIKTADGNVISSQTPSTEVVFGALSFVSDDGGVTIVNEAEFITHVDFSQLGNKFCFDTPRLSADQTVFVNGQVVPMVKQKITYNELDPDTHVLKATGLKISPALFEQQLNLKTGDDIRIQMDSSGRFEAFKIKDSVSVTDSICNQILADSTPTLIEASYDGFITPVTLSYNFIYVDPLDILLGNYPPSEENETESTETETETDTNADFDGDGIPDVVDSCPDSQEVFNGYQDNDGCPDVNPEAETPTITGFSCDPNSSLYDQLRCEELQSETSNNQCITLYDPVCGTDGKTYGNSCFAEEAGQTVFSYGTCDDLDEQPVVIDPIPDTDDGVVGVCNPEIEDCETAIEELESNIEEINNSLFGSATTIIALIIIIATLIGFIVVWKRRK